MDAIFGGITAVIPIGTQYKKRIFKNSRRDNVMKKQLFQIFPPELEEETIGWIQTIDNIYAVYKRGSECKIDIIVPKEKKRIPWLKFQEDGLHLLTRAYSP